MDLFLTLLIVLCVARAFGELAQRLGQAPLIGELVGGILLGLVVRRFPDLLPLFASGAEHGVFHAFVDLGMFLLMLLAGVQVHPRELAEASAGSLVVATSGMLLPFVLGFGLAWWFLPDSPLKGAQAMFLGTSLAITAIPAAVRVLMDLGQLHSVAGRIIVSAAIVDDILSLVLLSILTAIIRTSAYPGVEEIVGLLLRVGLFFVVTLLFARYLSPIVAGLVRRLKGEDWAFSMLLVLGLAAAVLAEWLELHFVVGAFMAGLFFVRTTLSESTYETVRSKLRGVSSGFLAPIFFASIGLDLDLSAVTAIPLFLGLYVFVAFFSKLAGAGLPTYWLGMSRVNALLVGTGMSARGAVELVIAEVALRAGLFSQPTPAPPIVAHLFSAVVIMAVVTTLLAPLALRYILNIRASGRADEEPNGEAES